MLLVEYNVLENVQVITEGKGATQKKKLRGKFQKCDEQNNNGRIYPKKVLESQVKAIQEKIGDRSLVGALDHPANDAIHLSQASHLITNLWLEDNGDVMGECEILSTPNGQIVQNLIDDGVKIGISSRGVGSVSESIKGKVVNEDFKLITFDLVSDPSTRGAFPELTESMRENSERAQAIVSKHKQDRALATTFANMIEEAMAKKKAKKKLDPVGQEDGDIDNDGDEDETDSYLKNRRDAVRKAMTGSSEKKSKESKDREDEMYAMRVKRAAKKMAKKSITSSTDIFGQKVVEAYRNLVRKDEMGAFGRLATARSEAGETARRKFVKPGAMKGSRVKTNLPADSEMSSEPFVKQDDETVDQYNDRREKAARKARIRRARGGTPMPK